jgi:phage-related protein
VYWVYNKAEKKVIEMMNTTNANIRYTTVLPAKYVEELKHLAAQKVITSVNNGIREAIELYLGEARRKLYAQKMAEAANDQGFLERTLDAQSAFSQIDDEAGGQW